MNEAVRVSMVGDVAVVLIDNPPVNALSTHVREGLAAALDRVAHDSHVRAVVVRGAGRMFSAGADIKELENSAWNPDAAPPDLHDFLARLEGSPVPVVMALHGTTLGGALELAMAGHYRVATADARFGLPEVNLGIIPGAEGTQRLPRLVGVPKAIEMCVSGKPIPAPDALSAGLIDRIIDGDLESGAVAFAREVATSDASSHPVTSRRMHKLGAAESHASSIAAGRELARKTRRNMLAPLTAIEAIEAAVALPFDEGCRRERELALQSLRSDEFKALTHAFFAERRAATVADVPADVRPRDIRRVAIVGAGTMGTGIAMACANAGLAVVLTDSEREALDRAAKKIVDTYDASVKRGRLSAADADDRRRLIRGETEPASAGDADLVIEAAFENLALKKEIFAGLDRIAKPGSILATNTSTLDIDQIAAATSRPTDVIGLHFFSPAHVMRLLEIVRGRETSPETLATGMAIAKRLGKVGVVVRNGPGFVGNRMMFPYMYEAQFLVEEGATPEHVDRVLTEWGMAMGIFAVDDMGGLDVAWRVRQELHQFEESGARKPLVSDALVQMGRLGQKTGKGWYRYEDGRTPIADPEVLALIERIASEHGMARRMIADQEIRERTIYALINEGARVLEEGVAQRASDIDTIYLTGYGFPAYRGGPMFYADSVGLRTVYERVARFHETLGRRWAPAPLLERLAKDGSTFRELDASGGIAGSGARA